MQVGCLSRTCTRKPLRRSPSTLSGKPTRGCLQTHVYDALARSPLINSIPRGLTYVGFLPYGKETPMPTARIVAAIWEDGSTFGSKEGLEPILAGRRATLAAYDRLLLILQGVEKNWTSSQYIDALRNGRGLSPAVLLGVERTLQVNAEREGIELVARALFSNLKQERDRLARSLPDVSDNARSNQESR